MHPKRSSRVLIFALCLSLAAPPVALAQTGASAATATRTAKTTTASNEPANVADGVFGVYGGAESRFANRPGEMSGLRAPLSSMQLPDLGDGSGGTLSPQAERKVGERMMREVRNDPDYLDDWLMRDYLDSVAAKLSAAAATQYLGGYQPDFDLFAVRDPQINAFSMPGGFIGVNTGLISATQTESELASVIGHEMGHVLQRHIARMIGAQQKSTYAALAAMLAGVLAGVMARSGDLGMGIAMGGQAFAIDSQLKFSRAAEHEADRVGFQMLTAAGYDPYAMTAFFARLDRATMSDNGVPPYARTHPLTIERIADMEDRARRVPYRQPRQSAEYAFVRARARVVQVSFTSDYREVASRLKSEIGDQTALNPAANWYGIALAQSLMSDYDAANESLAKARKLFEGEEASTAAASVQAQKELKGIAASPSQASRAGGGAPKAEKAQGALRLGNLSASSRLQSSTNADAAPSTEMSSAFGSSAQGLLGPNGVADKNRKNAAASAATAASSPPVALPPVYVSSEPLPDAKSQARAAARSTPSLDVLAADIARRAGRNDDAIRLAEIAQKRWPESHAAIDVHLQALLSAHRYADAQALARRETRAEPTRPDWWLYLAQASAGLKDPLNQHQAMAEKLALDGAWPSAIRQLKEARDVKSASFYDLSTISARLRDFETRYKEEREEEKNG